MSLSETDGLEMNDVNDDISSYFKAGHTFRVGGEYRITPQLSARLGYANQLSPMKVSTGDELNIAGMAPGYAILYLWFGLSVWNFLCRYGLYS